MTDTWGTDSFVLPDSREVAVLPAGRALECAAAAVRVVGAAQAVMMHAIARLNLIRQRDKTVADEIAVELGMSRHAAASQVDLAETLTTRLPGVLAELEAGTIDLYRAGKIRDVTVPLPDEQCREVDGKLAPRLAGKDATQIRRAARDLVHQIDAEGAYERAVKRRDDRAVRILHDEDAMATLEAYLPAETAAAIYARLDTMARRRRHDADGRTLDQLRADTLSDLLLGLDHSADHSHVAATVFLHVPLGTALGVTEHGAFLEGHGPIPGAIARDILNDRHAVWKKVLTDPASGAVLDVGRTTRRPPAAVTDLVRARDRECGVRHCHRPAHHAHLDHVKRWRHNGDTSTTNLHALCRHHNLLREKPGWDVVYHDATGETTIITPTGHRFRQQPEPLTHPRHVNKNDAPNHKTTQPTATRGDQRPHHSPTVT